MTDVQLQFFENLKTSDPAKYAEAVAAGIVPNASSATSNKPSSMLDGAAAYQNPVAVAANGAVTRNGINYDNYSSMYGQADGSLGSQLFGGTDANLQTHTGIVAPALGVAKDIYSGVMAYQNLKATKENNAQNLALQKENQRRAAIDQANQVAEANRKTGLLLGNSNSYASTVGIVNNTPYGRY